MLRLAIADEINVKQVNVVRQSLEAMHPVITLTPNWMLPQSERNLPLDSSFLNISPVNI